MFYLNSKIFKKCHMFRLISFLRDYHISKNLSKKEKKTKNNNRKLWREFLSIKRFYQVWKRKQQIRISYIQGKMYFEENNQTMVFIKKTITWKNINSHVIISSSLYIYYRVSHFIYRVVTSTGPCNKVCHLFWFTILVQHKTDDIILYIHSVQNKYRIE